MSIYDDYVKWMKGGGAVALSPDARAAQSGQIASTAGSGSNNKAAQEGGQSPLEWGLDIISRPGYAIKGFFNESLSQAGDAIKRVSNDVRTGKSNVMEALFSVGNNYDLGKMGNAAWRGLTSNDPEDKTMGVDLIDTVGTKLAEANQDTYEAPTLDNVNSWGDFFAATGRGAGGFTADVALDPVSYIPIPIVAAGRMASRGIKAALPAGRAARAAGETAKATEEVASAIAPTARAEQFIGGTAPTGEVASVGRFGAANVASPSTAVRDAISGTGKTSASSAFNRVVNPAASSVPKVSETLSRNSDSVVEALLKTNRELDKVSKSAREVASEALPTPKAPKTAPKTPAGMGDFARQFFGDADQAIAQLRAPGGGTLSNIFPSNIVKGLSAANPQAASTYWNRLVAAAKDPKTSTPQLREFLTEASRWNASQKTARTATTPNPSAVASSTADDAVAAVDTAVSDTSRTDLLRSILKDPKGKPTELGKTLRDAIGDKLFRQISSGAGGPVAAATRTRVFDELSILAKDADSLSPATFDGMHENVRHFVEDTLNLRREDFDIVARQKAFDSYQGTSVPRVSNPATARGVDPKIMSGVSALTGLSPRAMLNRYDDTMRRIVGDTFNPAKGKWQGGSFNYVTDDGLRYVIKDGNLGTYTFTSWMDGARKTIDDALTPARDGFYAGRVSPIAKTKARREQIPNVLRDIEKTVEEGGLRMGVDVDGTFVPMKPSHTYDSANDLVQATRVERGADAAREIEKRLDIVLYNPGTAAPDSLFFDAMGAAINGADDAALNAILGRTKSVYNGVPIKRQPLGIGRAGGRMGRTEYTSTQLRAMSIDLVRRLAPGVQQRGQSMAREYFEKSITDASAISTKIEAEAAEQLARSEGAAFAYYADIEKRLVELTKEYGASAHAAGLSAEELAKQLPPWVVQRAKSVRRTQTAYINAARAGKSVDEMRAMGATSEMRHTPVEVNAAADDYEWMVKQADELAEEGDELYGLGTKAASVLNEEIKSRSLWRQMAHPFRTGFDAKYGAIVDGVDMTESGRWAMGSAAKDIYYRSIDITDWGKKHGSIRIGETDETIASAAFKLMQQGVDEVPAEMLQLPHGAHLAEALSDLKPIGNYFFDVEGAGISGDMYWRAGSQNIRYLERSMETAGFTKKYGEVFADDVLNGTPQNWWQKVDVEDPVEFLQKYNTAVHHALGERLSVLRLTETLKDAGLMSTKPRPGFAKPELEGNSFFYAGLHESGAYIDKRVLDAMSEVDKKLYAARTFGEQGIVSAAIDPVLSAWKTGMTIYRPGHHVRNTLSNGMLSFVDQGMRNLSKSGVVAARLMALREGNRGLAGISELERLLTGAQSGLNHGGDTIAYTARLPRGKKLEISYDDLNNAFSTRGGYRTYMQSEDIIRGRGKLQKASDLAVFRGTRVEKVAAGLSEGLDHHGYLQHFSQIVMNNASKVGTRQFRTMDDLYDYAIKRSYRFHPDSAVLSPFEAKYVRRVIPFYTWFRGTLPGVVESSFKHPGRVMVAPKASYNIGQTFGIDGESLSNPWPEDSEVPDYLREGVFGTNAMFGDQMYTLNPGFAHQELASMFFGRPPGEGGNFVTATLSNAGRELLGMTNPMARVPVELAIGTKLQSGQTIRNGGDYIDDSIPYVNYLTSGTGISLTNNLLDPLGAIAQGRPHERSQVDSGYQASIFDEGVGDSQHRKLLNWLFGQSMQPVNTKEQAAAAKDARNARVDAREAENGTATPQSSSSGGSGSFSSSSGGNSSNRSSTRTPAPELSFSGEDIDIPLPADLDPAAAAAMRSVLESGTGKSMTPGQIATLMRDLQKDDLRRQSAMNYPGYAQSSLSGTQQSNPNLTIEELLALVKYTNPNPYKK